MTDAPIFVVGTPRSGTTLTTQILRKHPALFFPAETSFFVDIYARRREIGDPATNPEARATIAERLRTIYSRYDANRDHQTWVQQLFRETDILEKLREARSYREAFVTFMTCQSKWAGKRRWGNHHPRDLFELERIFAFFPDARVVVCVRNVLDFHVSYREKWKRSQRLGRQENAERLRKLYHPVITSLLWKSSMRYANTAFHRWGDKMFLNRYEDMVGDAAGQIRRLCDFIGEDFEQTMLDVSSNNSSQNVTISGIFTTSVEHWRGTLSDSEAYVALRLCRNELQQLGYVLPAVTPDMLSIIRIWLGTPFYGWRAFTANRDRWGPALPYLTKRITAIVHR